MFEHSKKSFAQQATIGILAGLAALGGVSQPAAAFTPGDIFKPVTSFLGGNRNQTIAIPSELLKENANGNTFNVCVSQTPCLVPPSRPYIPSEVLERQSSGGPSGPPPMGSSNSEPPDGPVLLVPPLQLPPLF
jgi:hypothetical protein